MVSHELQLVIFFDGYFVSSTAMFYIHWHLIATGYNVVDQFGAYVILSVEEGVNQVAAVAFHQVLVQVAHLSVAL
jgi:hypothetical protein